MFKVHLLYGPLYLCGPIHLHGPLYLHEALSLPCGPFTPAFLYHIGPFHPREPAPPPVERFGVVCTGSEWLSECYKNFSSVTEVMYGGYHYYCYYYYLSSTRCGMRSVVCSVDVDRR